MAGNDPDTVIHQARLAEFSLKYYFTAEAKAEPSKETVEAERWYDHNQARDSEIRRSSALVAYAA